MTGNPTIATCRWSADRFEDRPRGAATHPGDIQAMFDSIPDAARKPS
jgi:hypothetical protein